jgi:hypothetical protein
MSSQLAKRVGGALVLALAAGGLGYLVGNAAAPAAGAAPENASVVAPAAGTTRILYSLSAKRNDQELIALIAAARSHIYFAIYEFTLSDVADALVAAKERGVDVEGLVDAGEAASSYDALLIAKLKNAGIPVTPEHHPDGNGIMHIKALVTESAYAMGSYNWTESATAENDELLEIGTAPDLVAVYTKIIKGLIDEYASAPPGSPTGTGGEAAANTTPSGTYAYTDAAKHVGEYARITGTLVDAYTSASGTIFLDFCANYKSCPFSAVVFADDAKAFGDLSRFAGKSLTLTGRITAYQGQAEMVLNDPSQISQS